MSATEDVTTGPGPRGEVAATAAGRYPRPTVTLAEAEWVWRLLATEAMVEAAKPETVRLAVITGLTRATGARYSDLLRCTADAVDLGPGTARAGEGRVVLTHGKHRTVREHMLSASVVVVLRRWMAVREVLAAGLEGSGPPSGPGSARTPGGTPSSPPSSWNRVTGRPAGASSREWSDPHGVRVGGATSSAPASTSRVVAPAASVTSNATRRCPATWRPTSTSSIARLCAGLAISSVARPASR